MRSLFRIFFLIMPAAFSLLFCFESFALPTPELITPDQIKMMSDFGGKYKIISCEYTKIIDGKEDFRQKPCAAETLEISYQAPSDYLLNLYMIKGDSPHGGGVYIYGRRAWVKHTGCLELEDTTTCYNIEPKFWHEELTYRKNACSTDMQNSTDLTSELKLNQDGTLSLTVNEKIQSVYCGAAGGVDSVSQIINTMKLVVFKK